MTKGRDYSGARLLLGIRGLNHCAVSVGIRQCSVSLAEDSQMSCGPMRSRIAGRGRGHYWWAQQQPEFKAHYQMKG